MDRRKYLKTMGASSLGAFTLPILLNLDKRNKKTDFTSSLEDDLLLKANENILKYRKGEIVLSLRHKGRKLRTKEVEISQTSHDFEWGCSGSMTVEQLPDQAGYQNYLADFSSLFNTTTARCYWDERWHQPIEKKEGKRIYHLFDSEIDAGFKNGMKVKGHPLVWTLPKAVPDWLLKYSHQERMKIWKNHVQDMVKHAGKRVQMWDVVNEMLWEPTFKNIDKRHWPHIEPVSDIADYVAQSIGWARGIAPESLMCLNDYGLVQDNKSGITAKQQQIRYLELVRKLKDLDQTPDRIGVQAHVGGWYKPSEIKDVLDTLSEAGVPIQITEFWSRWRDNAVGPNGYTEKQKESMTIDYMKMFYTMAFGHPAVNHITYWGSPFFNRYGQKTRYYEELYELIHNQWTTKLTMNTDNNGVVSINGFKGDYTIYLEGKKVGRFEIKKPTVEMELDISGNFS